MDVFLLCFLTFVLYIFHKDLYLSALRMADDVIVKLWRQCKDAFMLFVELASPCGKRSAKTSAFDRILFVM